MRCLLQLREGAEDVEKNGAVPGIGSSYRGFSAVFLAPPCLCLRSLFISSDHVYFCVILQLNPTRTKDIINCISCRK